MKKTNLLVLALSALLVTSCGGNGKQSDGAKSEPKSTEPTSQPAGDSTPTTSDGGQEQGKVLPTFNLAADVVEAPEGASEYAVESATIYNEVYGQFYYYAKAADEAETIAERFALQGIAEAKLLEAGVLLPGNGSGGNYAVSRIVPYSITPVTWGSDNARYHNALVTTEPIKTTDRDALKALYKEKKGTGEYEAAAKTYLEGEGYTIKRSISIPYTSDPEVYDILNSYYATDSEPLVNTFDGLLEYNGEGEQKPALAESYTVSADGKTYTFTIRSGVKWVSQDGTEVADVTADDFVAGFQHMLDSKGGLEDLTRGLIVNAGEYIDGDVTDFSQVGVKAEGNKVIYTLEEPASYFTSMLGYSIFAPMSRSYYVSQGGKFGAEFEPEDAAYHYAEDYGHIVYCGPYRITQFTTENTFVFSKNQAYWNKDNINIDTITWLYNDGSDSTKAYNDFRAGTIDSATLNTAVLETAKTNGDFDNYSYISTPDANTYPFWFNINRKAFANANDETVLVSEKTDAQKEAYAKAIKNPYFRMALCMSVDRKTFYSVTKAEDIALNAALNSWTPAEFVSLPEAVTVKINGVDKTYPKNTMIGQVMQDQLDADGFAGFIKVFDPEADGGLGSGHGFDGWYNPENAQLFLAQAVEDLAKQGVTVSASNPIVMEFLTYENDLAKAQANAVKQSIEASTQGLVQVKVVVAQVRRDQLYAAYYPGSGSQMNYDCVLLSGWGPDYGDPKTYLDCFLPQNGGMAKCAGIY